MIDDNALFVDPCGAVLVSQRPVAVAGFAVGAASAGMKASGEPDVALVVADPVRPGSNYATAALFTENELASSAVRLSQANLRSTSPTGLAGCGRASAIVVLSGCANAATGVPGDEDQQFVGTVVADCLTTPAAEVVHLATGAIGHRIPREEVARAIRTAAVGLAATEEAYGTVAAAIRTSEARAKTATTTVVLPAAGGQRVNVEITGFAKGIRMVHPHLATMLVVLLTDAVIDPADLHTVLGWVASRSWNQLSVDGDTSTNDTVVMMASGLSKSRRIRAGSREAIAFRCAALAVARDLLRQQLLDASSSMLTCVVSGASDDVEARAVARAVASSRLVQGSLRSNDGRWGRILAAIGNARLPSAASLATAGEDARYCESRANTAPAVRLGSVRISVDGRLVYAHGRLVSHPTPQPAADVAPATEVSVEIELGIGSGTGSAYGSI